MDKSFDHSILRCPISKEPLSLVTKEKFLSLISKESSKGLTIDEVSYGLLNTSESVIYPVINDIILLLSHYGIVLNERASKDTMSFDKERVFNYYNEINYKNYEEAVIYSDSNKWVDFRPVCKDYIEHSFTRAGKFINYGGKYLLDIASGPIGLKEYMALSDNYEFRICIDISFNALVQAQQNYGHKKGIFICGDITNIPLADNVCDAVLSQHTLYHIPKNEQKNAVEELYRVAKPGATVAIIYNWFFYSSFMNIATLPIQIYRLVRHFAGKVYVRLFSSKPRLYFFIHSPKWFKQFPFYDKMEFYCWRSVNKYFLRIYIHKRLWGKKILNKLQFLEDKHSTFFGRFGDYPIIIIKK